MTISRRSLRALVIALALAAVSGAAVLLARPLLADPDWPRKVQAGEALEEFDFGMFSPLADLDSAEAWAANR